MLGNLAKKVIKSRKSRKKYIGLLVKSRHVLFIVLLFFLQKAQKAQKSMKK